MNNIRCPQCGLTNWATAAACIRCRMPFDKLPPHAYVSLPAYEQAQAQTIPYNYRAQPQPPADPELQRKVWTWYVVYCVLMTLIYFLCLVGGIVLVSVSPQMSNSDRGEAVANGIWLILVGAALMVPFAIAPFLPKKSWGWIYGLVMLIIGAMSCCFWPITIPLIIQWVKPDIKQMFGHR
ncbi:MAG: hypothetical protein H7Y30_04010 [Pyrinomonadaceae bacterium]|nr:hypothetical protein [Pyrinomonadaceae bacterium]